MSLLSSQAAPSRTGSGVLLLLGSCLPVLGGVLIAPVLPRIAGHFAGNANVGVLVPIVLTLPALMIALFSPFAGWLSDRLGRKRLLVLAMLLYGICGPLPMLLDDLDAILLSRAGLGLAEAAIMTCCTALIGDYYDGRERVQLLSWQTIVTSLSATAFFMLGGLIGEQGWRVPFAVYIVGLLLAPLMHLALRAPPQARAAAAPARSEPQGKGFPWRSLSVICLMTLLASLGFFIVPVQTGFLLEHIGIDSPQRIGMAIGLGHSAVFVGALCFRRLSRFGPGLLLALAFLISSLGLLLLVNAVDYRTVVIAVLINGLGGGLALPTVLSWALSTLSFEHRGKGTGLFNAGFFGGQFVSPLLVMSLTGLAEGRVGAVAVIGWGLLLAAAFALIAPLLAGLRLLDPIQVPDDMALH
ncbi:MFS transporter [Pseudomonas gingeri]|uniref:MFS transporter n=1 Tax=Pseudomonas gingeri TaxID=117681 RepID=A0A7Y7YCL4_9PSED|nr:MFS transporter [Pseudomonas gingeri]NWA02288.1 MFS transporter [Pseudomonas gingeri]NWA12539.1 MFS transporter [Pseudomonas gingeri]NWA57055.1 MFS transporter [Pseudomonas gingeri]NWA93398.1 MFS transporter [Pseudomonas gingeri]NWB02870.1 MFS transporter [Pseudomonas gingeri]